MQSPAMPLNENARQRAVDSYQLLDSPPEIDFDNITALASYICDVPVSLITMLDGERNWFKSVIGVPFSESPRELSFCGHAIHNPKEVMIVEDAREDERFHDNPLVAEMKAAIFYVGVPIMNEESLPLGTLCVFDNKPRKLSEAQINALKALGNQVESLYKLRRYNLNLGKAYKKLQKTNDMLTEFTAVASHDIKLPIASIITTADILKIKLKDTIDADGLKRLNLIKECSFTITEYITGMLEMYTSDKTMEEEFELFNLNEFFQKILKININTDSCQFWLPQGQNILNSNKIALSQIFTNLFTNAMKYNDKNHCIISVQYSETSTHYNFSVTDNGPGIPKEHHKTIFKLFSTATETDRSGQKGSGIGLSVVKKLIKQLNGKISVSCDTGKSTTFEFTIGKPSTFVHDKS